MEGVALTHLKGLFWKAGTGTNKGIPAIVVLFVFVVLLFCCFVVVFVCCLFLFVFVLFLFCLLVGCWLFCFVCFVDFVVVVFVVFLCSCAFVRHSLVCRIL